MNARELLDHFDLQPLHLNVFTTPLRETILSALTILAAAEANDGTTPETDAHAADTGAWGPEDANWPDFARALERQRNGLAAKVERLREDAERWNQFCELWAVSTELVARQDEDGAWSITQAEPVENEVFITLVGDTPDAAIDSARAAKPDLAPLMHEDPEACAEYWRKP